MAKLSKRVQTAVARAAGSSFWLTFVLTSSNVLNSAATNLTDVVVDGDLIVEEVVLMTDSTGLAGGTNFEISVSGEVYGINLPIVETVANLGASALRKSGYAIAADTTNDNQITVTNGVPFVLQAGDRLQYGSSVADCTGAGRVLVAIKFTRVTDNANVGSAV